MLYDNDNELPRTRAEAKQTGATHYFTGKPCKHGHIAERSTSDAVCQECNRERSREFARNNPELKRQKDREYYWSDPEARRESARIYAAANAEAARVRAAAWRLANPERAAHNDRIKRARKRGAGGSHTLKEITGLLRKQNYRCVYCRASIRKKKNRHVDHIMPLKLGGSNDITNIQLLCPTCNMSKKASHPVDYARRIGLLV